MLRRAHASLRAAAVGSLLTLATAQLLHSLLCAGPGPRRALARETQPARALPARATPLARLSATQRRGLRSSETVRAVQRVAPAVIAITTRRKLLDNPLRKSPWGSYYRYPDDLVFAVGLGSGVIIDPAGYALTNEHVISRADDIRVKLFDGRHLEAKVVGATPALDLAVLKIDSDKPLPAAPLGRSSDLIPGETAIAIGNPHGLDQSVTRGVISAQRRTFPSNARSFVSYVQTDAPLHPGNSGGPLVNIVGEVVGINTALFKAGSAIGLAVPMDVARQVYRDIRRYGRMRSAELGLKVGFTADKAVRITQVTPRGPAARAGIQKGDLLFGLRGFRIKDRRTYWRVVRGLVVGERVDVHLKRGGRHITTHLRVKGRLEPLPALAHPGFERRLGVEVASAAVHQKRLGLESRLGVVLIQVKRGGRAWRRNLRPKDVIIKLKDRPVPDVRAFNAVARSLIPGHQFFVEVKRGGKTYRFVMRY